LERILYSIVRLLGLIIDKTLSFSKHVLKLKRECNRRLFQFSAISGSDWGGSCTDLRGLYIAYIRSLLECCSATFSPLLSRSRQKELEVLQNKAARIMTGCVKATDIESLLLEANLLPLEAQYEGQVVIAAEKARRLPENDPLRMLAKKLKCKSRLVNSPESWKHSADRILLGMDCTWEVGRRTERKCLSQLRIGLR
jgi:hypothetical protein